MGHSNSISSFTRIDGQKSTDTESYLGEWHNLIDENQILEIGGLISLPINLKLEGGNPAGSIKFKTAIGLIKDVQTSRSITEDTVFIESSSGNLGIALSLICAQLGYKFCCIVDPNTPKPSIRTMKAFGANVICVEKRDENGGYLGTRIRYINDQLSNNPNLIWLNQYKNPAGPAIHANTTAPAIHKNIPDITHLFVGAGTTGTLMGCAQYFRSIASAVKVIAVDTVGSITFGGIPGPRHVPGMGTSRVPEICFPDLVDDVVHVREIDAISTCRNIAKKTGWLFGGSTGSVLQAIQQYAARLPNDAVVATLSPDFGERYLDTVYDDAWVQKVFNATSQDISNISRNVTADRKQI